VYEPIQKGEKKSKKIEESKSKKTKMIIVDSDED
jgi:hypothetical protein